MADVQTLAPQSHRRTFLIDPPRQADMATVLSRITTDPAVCGGRPCIRGMRIRVSDVLDLMAAGATTAEILRDYPYLEAEDLEAVLKYAARRLNHPTIAA